MTVCFLIATTETAAANAIILQYTSPLWVFLISPLVLHERLRLTEGMALMVSMAGVAVIFLGNQSGSALSLTIALASGLGYGCLTVILRRMRSIDPALITCMNCLCSGLLLLPAVVLWGSFRLGAFEWELLLGLSLVQFALPYVLFSWALQRIESHRAALIVLLEAILNPLLTYLIVGEPVPPAARIGGPLILAGVAGWILVGLWHAAKDQRSELSAPALADT
jgi:drug/metabolite transporter, DME family